MRTVHQRVSTPVVRAAVGRLGSRGGVAVLLLSVENWSRYVVIHTAAEEGGAAEDAVAAHQRDVGTWARERESTGRSSEPPVEPGVALAESIGLGLQDDVGTAYRVTRESAGGSGFEWH